MANDLRLVSIDSHLVDQLIDDGIVTPVAVRGLVFEAVQIFVHDVNTASDFVTVAVAAQAVGKLCHRLMKKHKHATLVIENSKERKVIQIDRSDREEDIAKLVVPVIDALDEDADGD